MALRTMINATDVYRDPCTLRGCVQVTEVQGVAGEQATPHITLRDRHGCVRSLSFATREDAVAFFAFGLLFFEKHTTEHGDMLTLADDLQDALDDDKHEPGYLTTDYLVEVGNQAARLGELVAARERALRQASYGTAR